MNGIVYIYILLYVLSVGKGAQISCPQSAHVCIPGKQQQRAAELLPPGGSQGDNSPTPLHTQTPSFMPVRHILRAMSLLQDVIIPELMKKLDILGDNGVISHPQQHLQIEMTS